jgi:NADPH-dependent 2,4-dienoyl-CoA reductase/sulfur reductase-like enzyme
MIAVAARAPRREDFTEVARFYGQELRRLGVAVEFGRDATGEAVEEFGADAVILAIGGRPVRPDVPGAAENPYWASVVDALTMQFDPGKQAVVYSVSKNIDPMTVADLLAERGAHVTLVTPHARPGADVDDATFPAVMGRLQDKGVDVVTGSLLDAIDDGAVRLRGAFGGSTRTLPEPDTLIVDVGWEPAEDLAKLQAAISAPVQVIGDAFAARGLQAAVWDGSRAGRAVK